MIKWLKENYLYLTALALLVTVAYGNSLGNGFVADDVPEILNNSKITENKYFLSDPRPLVPNIIYFGLVKTFGRSPIAFRLTNILFHLGNVWLLYLLITYLLNRKVAILAAAIFAVHPVLIESVTWISGGPYPRYSFFILLALVLYVLAGEWQNNKLYWASTVSFAFALSNSEKAIVLPLILLTLEISCQSWRQDWKRLIPFFALSGFWSLTFLGKLGQRIVDLGASHYQTVHRESPLLQVPIAVTSYLELIFWPKNLTLYHSEMIFSATEYYLRLAILIVFLGLIVYSYKKSKPVFFWLSFFLISLLLTLIPLGISWIVAERYVYLGAIGIFVVIAMGIKKIGDRLGNPFISYAILLPLLLALTVRTIARNADWKNQDTLWLAAAKTSPSSSQNHNNLGDLYGRRGDLERSAAEFKKAIELKPNYADAYHNLANTYWQMGKVDEAVESFKKAAGLNPQLWQSCQNLAAIYFEQKDFAAAKDWMEKAVAANPEDPNLQRNLEIINAQLSNP